MDAAVMTAPTASGLFRKWKKWLDRLEAEFVELLIKQRHFHELKAVSSEYVGEGIGAELARSMVQGYVAFAVSAIRRLSEPAKAGKVRKDQEIISLPILLEDLKTHGAVVTRDRQRNRYKREMKALPERIHKQTADRVHHAVTRGFSTLRPSEIETDLRKVRTAVGRIDVLANKVFAHIER